MYSVHMITKNLTYTYHCVNIYTMEGHLDWKGKRMSDKTRVVNIRHEECDIYIGRPSKWGNPFIIGRDGTREEVIEKYHVRLLRSDNMLAELPKLFGKRLGCYCKPLPCHGDVLLAVIDSQSLNEAGMIRDAFPEGKMNVL